MPRITSPIIALLLLTLPLAALAQQQQHEEIDEKHPQVVAFAKKMASLKSMKADFSYIMQTPKVKMSEGIKGKLETKGNQYHVSTPGLEIFSNDTVCYQYLPEQKEVVIQRLDEMDSSPLDHPMRIFTAYDKHFKVRYRGERKEAGKAYYDYSFYPRSMRQPFSQIHLSVLQQGYVPAVITYQGKDGSTYKITLTKVEVNAPVQGPFRFDPAKHPEVEIVDLR